MESQGYLQMSALSNPQPDLRSKAFVSLSQVDIYPASTVMVSWISVFPQRPVSSLFCEAY